MIEPKKPDTAPPLRAADKIRETAKELVMRRRLARAEPPGPSVRA